MSPRRRYTAITFLTWLPTGLYAAAMVLLMLDRGLSLPTIATIGVLYSITVTVLELPTGGLADVIGRRPVLIASALASLTALVVMGLATTAAGFAIAAVLRGTARALGTGPAEAWYVDMEEAEIGPGLASGSVAASVALTIGTLVGGLIPITLVGVVQVPLAVPMLLAALVEAVRLAVIVVAMKEGRRTRSSNPLKGAWRLAIGDGVIARLLLVAGGVGMALATIELLTPAWLATLTGTFETAGIAYAIVAALGFAASAVGAGLSTRATRLTGTSPRTASLGLLVMALALAGLAGTTVLTGLAGVIAAAMVYFVIFVGLGVSNPAAATMLHERTASEQRATVVSLQSLCLQLSGAIGAVGFAWIAAETGPATAFALAAAVIVASALTVGYRDMSVLLAKLSR